MCNIRVVMMYAKKVPASLNKSQSIMNYAVASSNVTPDEGSASELNPVYLTGVFVSQYSNVLSDLI